MSIEHILIKPTTFHIYDFQENQNPYITPSPILKKSVMKSHDDLEKKLSRTTSYTIKKTELLLPDIVFVANGGLSLKNLPEQVFILPNMKYKQRKEELPFLEEICENLGLVTVPFGSSESVKEPFEGQAAYAAEPFEGQAAYAAEPFEGQAEAKWFHNGSLLVCGYGHRSTKKTFTILKQMLEKIYKSYKKTPPKLLVVPLESADYYHLDVAMLEFNDSECIVHKRAFSEKSIKKLQDALGKNNVHVLDTDDHFCLNAVVDGSNLLTHVVSEDVKRYLESKTGLTVRMIDTKHFEKSGGSVRCMVLDIHQRVLN